MKKRDKKPAPKVLIVVGSDSDLPAIEETVKVLTKFEIPHEVRVSSAHRAPEKTRALAARVAREGIQVVIAGAGHAAHLAGVLAAELTVPVIGVPLESGLLSGLDALLSTVMMPPGIPVATMAVGRGGARNAGVLAAQILALTDPKLRKRLVAFKAAMAAEVDRKDRARQTRRAKA
ncbi:MAG: 5-(carboxyamino)imidazole ribonucleotide mutase [Deltaproteobacteria bacterium RBG_13_65_10]|nr:MAG: 5-(carboxyamino)imidazole ribonucleotide mutase [Deltaproteobacteria bacterium RBG_13_65_10]